MAPVSVRPRGSDMLTSTSFRARTISLRTPSFFARATMEGGGTCVGIALSIWRAFQSAELSLTAHSLLVLATHRLETCGVI